MNHEIISLASKMIEVPSLSKDVEANKVVLDIASEFLGNQVFSKTFIHKDPNTQSVAISRLWGDPNTLLNPQLLLSGHVDVVDVDGDTTLFQPKIDGNILKGRGSGDMKGHDAAMLYAYKNWITDNNGANGVGLLLSSDEEVGGFNGTRYVVSQGLSPKVVFIPDGDFNFDIVESQKAPYHFVISVSGPGGHVSQAYKLDNPLNRLFTFYSEARSRFAIADQNNIWASTFEMTVINTLNQSKNKIPDIVTAAFGWRWPLEQMSFEYGKKIIYDLCEKYGCKLLEEEGGGEGCLTDRRADFVNKWKSTIEGVIGREVGFTNMHGATDGRHFYNSKEFGSKNVLVTSAITGAPHQTGEWIDIQSLSYLADAIYEYFKKI